MRARKKDLGDWRENGSEDREPKCSHFSMKSAARSTSTREQSMQQLAKQKSAWVFRNDHILVFGEVFKTLLEFFQHMLCHPSRTALVMRMCQFSGY